MSLKPLIAGMSQSPTAAVTPVLRVLDTDESRVSTTTPSDITGFSVPVAAGETWVLEAQLCVTSAGSAGGISFKISVPSGSNLRGRYTKSTNNGNPVNYMFFDSFVTGGTGGDMTDPGYVFDIRVGITFTNSGTLALQAAQDSSNATETVIKAGSFMRASRM